MNYYEAAKIRKKGFADLMADKLTSGQGVFSSARSALSDRSKARSLGFKEKFDPLNIAKVLTGGSNLAPAMLGRLLGRKTSDIRYFTGKKEYTPRSESSYYNNYTTPSMSGGSQKATRVLQKMLSFMEKSRTDDMQEQDTLDSFNELNEKMREDRHKEVVDVFIQATKVKRKAIKHMAKEAKKRQAQEKAETRTGAPSAPSAPTQTAPKPPAQTAPKPGTQAKDAADAAKKAKDAKDAADAAKKAKDAADAAAAAKKAKDAADAAADAKKAKDAADAADAAKKAKDAKDAADAAKKAKDAKDAADAAKKAKDAAEVKRIKDAADAKRAADTAKKQESVPKNKSAEKVKETKSEAPTAAPAPATEAAKTAAKVVMGGSKGLVLAALVAAGYSTAAQANIMANVDKESGFEPRSEELEKYTGKNLFSMYGGPEVKKNKSGQPLNAKDNVVRFNSLKEAEQLVKEGPVAVGDLIYGGRMGNTEPGDGYKYRGRGFIQITGKDMYNRVGKLIGVDLVNNPDLANQPEIAAKIIPAFFKLKAIERKLKPEQYDDINVVNKAVGSADAESRRLRVQLSKSYSEQLNSMSTENADIKKDMSQGSSAGGTVIIQNNNTTQAKNVTHRSAPQEKLNPTMR